MAKTSCCATRSAQALPPDPRSKDTDSSGFSIVPKDETLRIVGIVETDPAGGFGPFGRGRLFIPMQVAETLRAAQTNDLRDLLRDTPNKRNYESLTVRVSGATKVKEAEDRDQEIGVFRILAARCHTSSAAWSSRFSTFSC